MQLDAQVVEDASGDAITLAHQPQEEVFGADVVMVEALGFFLRELQHFPCALGKFVKSISHI